MNKYIDANRLRALLEARYNTGKIGQHGPFRNGKTEALRETIELIDSLQQEQPKDLEEAAEKYADSMGLRGFDKVRTISDFKAGAEWKELSEADLEKEIVLNYAHEHYYYDKDFDGYGHSKFRPVFTRDDLIGFAHHFYLLGLNARKKE